MCHEYCLLPPTPTALQGLTIVHGRRVDGGHRLWVASRVTVARLWVSRVPARQDRWLPVAPRGQRVRVQGVAVLIWRWGTGVGHGGSRAEGRPQLLGPERKTRKAVMSAQAPLTQPQSSLPLWKGKPHTFSPHHSMSFPAHRPLSPSPQYHPPRQLSPCPSAFTPALSV